MFLISTIFISIAFVFYCCNPVEVAILPQDAAQGKENRQQSNELIGERKPIVPTMLEKNDNLSPIASEEELEFVGLPGSSHQLSIPLGPGRKKKKKKKKKKSLNPRMLTLDDFVSSVDTAPSVLGFDNDYYDEPISRAVATKIERAASPLEYRNVSPVKRSNEGTWNNSRSPTKRHHDINYGRSDIRHERSPSPHRRSPRQFVSPRKSPIAAIDRRAHYDNTRATVLLKKVRKFKAAGANTPARNLKNNETSLKQKLSFISKGQSESKENIDNSRPGELRTHAIKTEFEDEEDLELLRRRALETQQRSEPGSEENDKIASNEPMSKGHMNISDDDSEDLELRLIALQSAVLKKHEKRQQRGVKRPEGTNVNDESPFDFLDDLDSEEEEEKQKSESDNEDDLSPVTNSPNLPDMELDSDVEREKNNSQPYSPSDEIAERTFIETDYPNMSLAETSIDHYTEPLLESNPIITNASYLEKNPVLEQNRRRHNDAPYLPVNTHAELNSIINEPSYLHNSLSERVHINDGHYSQTNPHGAAPLRNDIPYFANNYPPRPVAAVNDTPYFCPPEPVMPPPPPPPIISNNAYFESLMFPTQPVPSPQAPYSLAEPTNAPRLDQFARPESNIPMRDPRIRRQLVGSSAEPHYSEAPGRLQDIAAPETASTGLPVQANSTTRIRLSAELSNLISAPSSNNKNAKLPPTNNSNVPVQSQSLVSTLSTMMAQNSIATSSNTITGNKTTSIVDEMHDDILRDLAEFTGEPLYIQGVPDVTKDTNKIPTLVNRTLVPVPILKTNKQLQQPLPQKKIDSPNEPAFKSAEMQPVNVITQPAKINATFKPIKLQPVMKKSQIMPSSASAFNNSFNSDPSPSLINEQNTKNIKAQGNGEKLLKNIANNTTNTAKILTKQPDDTKKKVRRSKTPKPKIDSAKKSKNTEKITVNKKNKTTTAVAEKRQSKTGDDKEKAKSERQSRKSIGTTKKSTVTQTKTDEIVKKTEIKRTRVKSVSKSDKKTDENSKSKANLNDNIVKLKKESKTMKGKISKNSDSQNRRSIDEKKIVDKRRRSSADEDVDELRAITLATMIKRPKTIDTETTKSDLKTLITTATNNAPSINKQKGTTVNTSEQIAAKKRANIGDIQGPSNKIAKEMPITTDPAQIVKQTKKLIDAEIQKKLAQNEATIAELMAQQTSKVTARNNTKIIKSTTAAPISPKITASKRQHRLVINLGEDSDSDSEKDEKPPKSSINTSSNEAKKIIAPALDLENRVEAFLRQQRDKLESGAAVNKTTTTAPKAPIKIATTANSTPLVSKIY